MPDGAAAELDMWAEQALDALLARVFAQLRPRLHITPLQWVETNRYLSPEENPDYVGKFSTENIPALRGVLAAAGEPGVGRIVGQKSAQIAWTAGVVCTIMGYHIHWRPCVQVAMFPRIQSAKDFDAEKFAPMVRATPVLYRRVRLKSRADGNSTTRKHYPGGLLKFVASNSPADVKSTSAKVRYVEEPDDTNKDVKGQGNSIALLRERGKTIRNTLEIIGGTPTAKGASEIEKEMRTTDQRRLMVPCHDCGERHDLDWSHVVIPGLQLDDSEMKDPDLDAHWPVREVFGRARWEQAYYACPHCGSVWTDEQRCANIRAAADVPPNYGWEPTAESADRGFYFNELQSVFQGSYVPVLAEKYLTALHELDRGEPEKMVAFWNASRGLPWEYKGELPEEDELAARVEKYAEWSCPAGGIVPVLSVDVQHDRLAVTCWVIGRGEEMWLAYWGELYGQTVVAGHGAWIELEQMLGKTVTHAGGAQIRIAAVGIDCSDGQTSDASYAFVRKHNRGDRQVLALKGASETEGRVEIWTPPKAIDPNHRSTKASRFGIQIRIVGAAKAKDLILGWAQEGGRVRLSGDGPGRMHWYEGVRADFFEQLLGEMKVPSRLNHNKRHWKARTDRRNEALDCTVYALYISRHLRLHLRRNVQWDVAELRLRQGDLIGLLGPGIPLSDDPIVKIIDLPDDEPTESVPTPAPAPAITPAPATEPRPTLPAPQQRVVMRRTGGIGRR
ncbi:MAG: phage terminase large subunit family protein [Deltaproteobacteria bacterium]|nr:phage terminase large subunit family protein [Deltaproteobacteria bacterium]